MFKVGQKVVLQKVVLENRELLSSKVGIVLANDCGLAFPYMVDWGNYPMLHAEDELICFRNYKILKRCN